MPHRGVFERFAHVHQWEDDRAHVEYARQGDNSDTASAESSTSEPTSSVSPPVTPTSNENTPTSAGTTSQPGGKPTTPPVNSPPASTPSVSIGSSTDANGSVVTFQTTVYVHNSAATPEPTEPTKPPSTGISKATITGIAVVGSIAVVAVIGFFVWKYMASRKRFSEFDADEIKWPELQEESHALPARPTGRHGAGLDGEDDVGSAYGTLTAKGPYGPGHVHNDSASQLLPASTYATTYPPTQFSHSGYSDNTPYSDSPVNPTGGYADPYAVPPPMVAGRQSPGPGVAYGARIASPGPGPGPGPGVPYPGYDVAGRQSPGPNVMYGRQSPAPQVAYGGYDAGRRSPGPGQAYGGV